MKCDWLMDDAVPSYVSDAAEHIGSGSELWLNDVKLTDSGTYMCTASNSQGSVFAHATLTVTGQLRSDATVTHSFIACVQLEIGDICC